MGATAGGGNRIGRRPASKPASRAKAPAVRGRSSAERVKPPARVTDTAAEPGVESPGFGHWRLAVENTVAGLHYELVDVERIGRGLLRVTIDRLPGHAYTQPGEAITVDDCEVVTRQLRYALEVDTVDYSRLEVSSPGLDRPLRREADYVRFSGQAVNVTLKMPFQGRKHYQGVLGGTAGAWNLVFHDGKAEQVLAFTFDEVREARLVPVLNFKGRSAVPVGMPAADAETMADPLKQAHGDPQQ